MATRKLNEDDSLVIRAYADGNMNCRKAAELSHFSKEAVYDHLDKVHILTGKNPRNFYELHELLNMFEKGEIDFGRSHSD